METKLLGIVPVLPTEDMQRDLDFYQNKVGFQVLHSDDYYAVLKREHLFIHLQWHANTEDDPLLGGSVVRLFVDKIQPIFEEFVERGTVNKEKLRMNTPWNTHEFGFYDPNNNAIFIAESLP
ncbi:VOC family protein [Aureisphaera galaxeae]|uniref:VOC family protein n=1 Tax=Aureisphaera galaxeae TaxID=1538023 RepID=UPI00235085DB|nr:VOC family protein [Aureisphaera galaxeae]MDC8003571.1 VOC family protein [Aureisphaera galaxeae]